MTPALPDFVESLGHGVHAIDTGFQRDRFDAAYLIVHDRAAAFIDTGTAFAVPRLLAALDALDLPRSAVAHVIPTHVHLDHAGGVGVLMQALPNAVLRVHPRGARHMIDPSQLYQGALAVYGQAEMDRSYGSLIGVPAERVSTTQDAVPIDLAGRLLGVAHTPGHARHHHCIWDPLSRGWFTGDTFGLSYREFDSPRGAWIVPTSTPVQFEPEALRASIERLLALQPDCMYLTHYGRVGDVARLGTLLLELLDRMVDLGERHRASATRHDDLKRGLLSIYLDSLAAHGSILDTADVERLLALDVELNAQGMACWLDRPARAPANRRDAREQG